MLFQQRLDYSRQLTGNALGSTVTFELTREFPIEAIFIQCAYTPTAVMATANADSQQNILQRVQLTVADGARTRNIVDVSGAGLLEYAKQIMPSLDRSTIAGVGVNDTAAKSLTYPIFFGHPQLMDPTGSVLMLPAPRFSSNPILTLQFSTQAQMDVNVAPTYAVAAGISVRLIIVRRQVTMQGFPFFDTELAEIATSYASSGNSQLYELQIPGSYTGILFRCYTSTSARGDTTPAGGQHLLQLLGTVIRRFQFPDLQIMNDFSTSGGTLPVFNGSYYLDFLSDKAGVTSGELGSVLNANIPVASGARIQLLDDVTGGTGVQIKRVTHRIFGDLSSLKIGNRKAA